MTGWRQLPEADAGAVNRADTSVQQAASTNADPRPPQRLQDMDPAAASGSEPRTRAEDAFAHENRAARLDELLARAARAAQRNATQQTERQASSQYAARMEQEAQTQAEAGQQAEAQDEVELEL